MADEDCYQILENGSIVSIVRRKFIHGRPGWTTVVPNVGSLGMAKMIVYLLNEDYKARKDAEDKARKEMYGDDGDDTGSEDGSSSAS